MGAGGLGREVAAMLNSYFKDQYSLLGYIDDGKVPNDKVNGLYVLGGMDWLLAQTQTLCVVFGIGQPAVCRKLYERLKHKNNLSYPNIIHPHARIHAPPFVSMGQGNVICDASILTTNISMGDFNLINLSCTIGHDAVLGSFCSIMPGVNISGGAQLKNGVYVGTGAKLIKATTLGKDSIVGAGSVVNTDVPDGKTYAGVPAKELKLP